jgi:glutamine amidotransferase-like uncharacterized protein
MRKNSKLKTHSSKIKKGVAFLWDESFLWGIMAYKALRMLGLPFDLIRAEDIKQGILESYKMLFVPGGWASNKSSSLGDSGKNAIKEFVAKGGNYLGFCGGAGLATTSEHGIGLLNVKRRPTKERVPSFSGPICLNIKKHPFFEQDSRFKIQDSKFKIQNSKFKIQNNSKLVFHAWWPSQFMIDDENIEVLATYGEALPEAFSSDLNVGDVEINERWSELERIYQINLDPAKLLNDPAVIEGRYGKGRVILSLIHFDTLGDTNGQQVLINLWKYLSGEEAEHRVLSTEHRYQNIDTRYQAADNKQQTKKKTNMCSELYDLCSELISLGERNFLWFWRNPLILQWRRGIRGLEYNTLYIMIKEITEIYDKTEHKEEIQDLLKEIEILLLPFTEKAKRLLMLERHALQMGDHITYDKCNNPEIKKLRLELFSRSKSYGGAFKRLIDVMDKCLYKLLKINP